MNLLTANRRTAIASKSATDNMMMITLPCTTHANSLTVVKGEIPLVTSPLSAVQGIPILGVDEALRRTGTWIHWRINLIVFASLGMTVIENGDARLPVSEDVDAFVGGAA